MLASHYYEGLVEAGVDEAGRGCLAGPVYAAAVILPFGYEHPLLNDSKQLTDRQRRQLREVIERDAVAWAVGICSPQEIDRLNILNASIEAMHRALSCLSTMPQAVIVDGNRFKPWHDLPFTTIVKGDGKQMAIAAASILAKTYRDDCMIALAKDFPHYGWEQNKGYPTKQHRDGIRQHGLTPHHRLSFTQLPPQQLELAFE
ncbi:MAG: ribonuclease HII [Prevotella sp.]|nr:ribonuclease HII [Prevotella sp.]